MEPHGSVTLHYLLLPHNGHLQIGGKLIYEAMFAVFGTNYFAFRVLEVLTVLLCVGLFFELMRRRVGTPVALLLSVLLAFLGAAWEPLLWPFDLHTTLSLAAGLGALLALERGGRRADPIACLLLVVSVSLIEVGLAFLVGVAVAVLIRPDRARRLWIVLIPGGLFAAWYLWARQFGFEQGTLDGVAGLIPSVIESLAATLSALTGTLPTGSDEAVEIVSEPVFAVGLAIIVVIAFVVRLARGSLPASIWPPLVALLAYWVLIAIADRPPDSARYVFVGAVLLLLVAGDAARQWRPTGGAIALVAVLVAIALPANIAKLFDGGDYLARDKTLTHTEFAMLELAGENADPAYVSAYDPAARAVGSSPALVMTPPVYVEAAQRIGSLASSLDAVQDANVFVRRVDDVVLAGLFDIDLAGAPAGPARSAACRRTRVSPGVIELPPGGALLRASGTPAAVGISRFAPEAPSVGLGHVNSRDWSQLRIPADGGRPEGPPWLLFFDAPLRVCTLG